MQMHHKKCLLWSKSAGSSSILKPIYFLWFLALLSKVTSQSCVQFVGSALQRPTFKNPKGNQISTTELKGVSEESGFLQLKLSSSPPGYPEHHRMEYNKLSLAIIGIFFN